MQRDCYNCMSERLNQFILDIFFLSLKTQNSVSVGRKEI